MLKSNAIDLFAGAGGVSQALKNAGFDVRLAVEVNRTFARSYRLNHCRKELGETDHLIDRDICQVTDDEIQAFSDKLGSTLDLLAGCPPCQGFSRQMVFKKDQIDKRNYLVFEYLRFVKILRPKYIFLENVPGFGGDESIWPRVRDALQYPEEDGPVYKLRYQRIDAADVGVPQRRYRFVLVGKRIDLCCNQILSDIEEVPFADLTHKDKHISLRKYFSTIQLPNPIPLKGAPHEELHKYSNLGLLNSLRLTHTPPGRGRESWPETVDVNGETIRLTLKCHEGKAGYRDVYGRMNWESVAPTLTGGCLNISKGRFAHPSENRPITAREAALIQTFPMDYKFVGNWTEIALQIGNAVPVKMGEQFFRKIKQDLKIGSGH